MHNSRLGNYKPRTSVRTLLNTDIDRIMKSGRSIREKKAYFQGLIRDADTYLQREAAAENARTDPCSDYLIAKQTAKGCFMSTSISIIYHAARMFPLLDLDAQVSQNASYNNRIMPYIMQFLDTRNSTCPAAPTTMYAIYNTIRDRMLGSKNGIPYRESVASYVNDQSDIFGDPDPAVSFELFLRNPLTHPILEFNQIVMGLQTVPFSSDHIHVINQPRKEEKGGFEAYFVAAMLMYSNAYVVYSEIPYNSNMLEAFQHIASKVYQNAFHIIEKSFLENEIKLSYDSETLRMLLDWGHDASSVLSGSDIQTALIAFTITFKYPGAGSHVVSVVPCGDTNAIICNTDTDVSSCAYFDDYSYTPYEMEYHMTILDRIGQTYEEKNCTVSRVTYYLFNGVTMT